MLAPSISAETARSRAVTSKPPLSAAKVSESPAAPSDSIEQDPALCPQPGGAEAPIASFVDPDSPVQSSSDESDSELIPDKLQLSLEQTTNSGSEPAPQCGRSQNETSAEDKSDGSPN